MFNGFFGGFLVKVVACGARDEPLVGKRTRAVEKGEIRNQILAEESSKSTTGEEEDQKRKIGE
jgi:hypothetical protein